MDARQLKYFVRVYEERHLSRAAEQCNVSQSAVSFQIAKLEETYGTKLFVRDRQGMTPTASGVLLYRHATPLLKGFSTAHEIMQQQPGELAGDFSLGLAYSVVKVIGSRFLEILLADYPKIRLSLTESVPSSTLLHVLQNEIDLALTFNPPSHSELVTKAILVEPLVFIGRQDIIGPADTPIGIEELLTKPLIMYRQFASATLDSALQREVNARARVRMNSFQAIGFALKTGTGCFIGSKLYSRELLESGEVAMRPIEGRPITRTLMSVELASRPATFVGEKIRSLLIDLIEQSIRDRIWEADFVFER